MSTNSSPSTRRTLTIVLRCACGVLLLTAVALVFLFIGRGSTGDKQLANQTLPTPTSSTGARVTSSPTQAPSAPAPTTALKPLDKSTRFTSFVAPTTVKCVQGSDTKPLIHVSWSSANTVSAWYTANNGDAAND